MNQRPTSTWKRGARSRSKHAAAPAARVRRPRAQTPPPADGSKCWRQADVQAPDPPPRRRPCRAEQPPWAEGVCSAIAQAQQLCFWVSRKHRKQDLTETAGTATLAAGQGGEPTRLLMTGRSTRRGPRARRDTRRLREEGSQGTGRSQHRTGTDSTR